MSAPCRVGLETGWSVRAEVDTRDVRVTRPFETEEPGPA
jgi:hypothetical protein